MARRFPIATAWRASGVFAAGLLLTACAPSTTGGFESSPTPPHSDDGVPVSFLELAVGDCFDMPSTVADGEALRFASCETPHMYEAFAETSLPDGDFPGDDEVASAADDACEAAFVDFVGVSWKSSSFDYQYIVPSERTWLDVDDRSILCLVTTLSALPWTGSAEGTAA